MGSKEAVMGRGRDVRLQYTADKLRARMEEVRRWKKR